MTGPPLLELRGIEKNFGAVEVLRGVDLRVDRGEITALVGDNGAGKSTLIKSIAGIHRINAGEMLWEGKSIEITGPKDSARLGIEFVYQDLALCDNLDVVHNMFLGREPRKGVFVARGTMERKAREILRDLSVTTLKSVRVPVAGLSGGQRQSVAIAKAAMWDSRMIVLDEPTAALGVAQTRQVLRLVRELAHKGIAVLMISHNLQDVMEVADRVSVLRLGRMVADLRTADTDSQHIVDLITTGSSQRRSGPSGGMA